MRIIFFSLLLAFAMLQSPARAAETTIPIGENEGCMQGPLAEFGRYIGGENWLEVFRIKASQSN